MRVLCSPEGLMDGRHPVQGVRDILASGIDASVLDFCSSAFSRRIRSL